MIWRHLRKSKNVIDNRNKVSSGNKKAVVGGGFGFLLVAALGWLLTANPTISPSISKYMQGEIKATVFDPIEHQQFVQAMLGVSEDVWKRSFDAVSEEWVDPSLVLLLNKLDQLAVKQGLM